MRSSFKRVFSWALAVYLLLCAGFWFFQHLFFFHPKSLPADYSFAFSQKFKEQQIELNPKTLIDIVQFQTADSLAKGVVLYFHGNQENIERYAEYAPNFTSHGYECWMMDYPGFGKSTGDFTLEDMQAAATQIYKLARSKWSRENIIIYGKSLGTGLAAWLASVKDCRQLILETPYYSLASLAKYYAPFLPVDMLVKMNFTTNEYFKNITAPITIFHGLQDEVVPFTNAMRLVPGMKKQDRFIAIPGGKHNDLPTKKLYQEALYNLLREP
ncbi:MAG: alpha/beta fold hydrolase [Chitinophagaceae bacterium]